MAEDGHRLSEVPDSGEALKEVVRRGPDLIIMPDDAETVEGVDLLPITRGLTDAGTVVVGSGDGNRMARALFEGADVYLKYPTGDRELRSRVRALLRRRKERRRSGIDLSSFARQREF